MTINVLLGPSSFGSVSKKPIDRLLEAGVRVIDNPFKRKLTKTELMSLLSEGVDGIIAGLEPLDREVLGCSRLRVISRCGSGMSNVDMSAAKELDIQVFSTPYGPTNAVAELTIGCLISLLRHVPSMNGDLHTGEWNKRIGTELQGKTVVVIGYGRIGQRVAHLLSVFGVRIVVVDPEVDADRRPNEQMGLAEALPIADIITLHCSGTKRILDRSAFDQVKSGVVLLNAARGELIDESALIRALEKGCIAGAWLDTFATEPYNGRLKEFPQVILTPHVGSYTEECRKNMEMESVENLLKGFGICR